jgi:putative hydrolase of the HAD superfamily
MRGLLVDYGGVLTTDVFASFSRFCTREGLAGDHVTQLFRTDPAARDLLFELELGTIAEPEFEARFADLLGVASAGLIARMMADAGADTDMINAVRAARRQGIRTGLISNSWGVSRYDRALLADLFDGVVISGEVGVRKPATEIYQLGARVVSLDPNECVYVDDIAGNLKPARALGMTTVHHRSTQETIRELETLLKVALATGRPGTDTDIEVDDRLPPDTPAPAEDRTADRSR